MEVGTLLVLLLVLACPLMMVWMMRGHRGAGRMHAAGSTTPSGDSLAELRERRAELDAEIAQLEEVETEPKAPATV